MKRAIALSAVAVVLSGLLFSACGDDDDSSVSSSADQLCDDVAALNSTVQGIASQDFDLNSASITQVKDTLADIQSQIDDIASSKSELSEQVKSDLKSAFDQLKEDLSAVKDADSLAQARDQIQAARTSFRDAWEGTLSELNCSATTTG